jgi:hypothetical protein
MRWECATVVNDAVKNQEPEGRKGFPSRFCLLSCLCWLVLQLLVRGTAQQGFNLVVRVIQEPTSLSS